MAHATGAKNYEKEVLLQTRLTSYPQVLTYGNKFTYKEQSGEDTTQDKELDRRDV